MGSIGEYNLESNNPPRKNKSSINKKIISEVNEFWSALRNTPQAFILVWKTSKTSFLISILLTLIAAILPALQAWVGKLIIDSILDAAELSTGILDGIREVIPILSLEFALVFIGSSISHFRFLSDRILQSKLTNHVNSLIIKKAISLDLNFFENPLFYDTLQNARRQSDMSTMNIVKSSLQMIQQIITLFSLLILIIRFSPWLALIVFISAIPAFISQSQFAELSFRTITHRAPESRLLNYIEMLLTGNDTVKEIKLFGLGEPLLNRYQDLFEKFYTEDRAIAQKRSIASLGWGTLSSLVYYGSYVWIVMRTITKIITLGEMTMYLTTFRQSQNSIRALLDSLNNIYENNLFLDNFLSYLKLQPLIVSPTDGKLAPSPIKEGIEFRNVHFRYPGAESDVLKDINLRINPGERIALVGLNGAGKTTLVKLLTRLYDPTQGQILLDGIDLRDYDLHSLHQRFGVIFQDFVRYQFTVKENIGFGHIEDLDDPSKIKEAADRGGASPVIEKLPEQYNTMLGRRWEKGSELSGGEWQKIALARAFMRKADVMILDEPTSSLDAEAEYEVFLRFNELMEDKIAVLISHRFSTVRMADRIVLLSGGKILEVGSHQELIGLNGSYARLFNLQAEGYK